MSVVHFREGKITYVKNEGAYHKQKSPNAVWPTTRPGKFGIFFIETTESDMQSDVAKYPCSVAALQE